MRVPDAVSFNWRLHELPSIKKDTGIDVPKPTYAYNVVTLSYIEETPKSQLYISVSGSDNKADGSGTRYGRGFRRDEKATIRHYATPGGWTERLQRVEVAR